MIDALAYVLGSAAGCLGTWAIMKRPRRVKNPCPWEPCGYPLPKHPLVLSGENHKSYAVYAIEECEGCANSILYNGYHKKYERIATTKVKT